MAVGAPPLRCPRELRGTFAAVACVGTVTYNHIDAGAAVGAWRQWLRPRGLLCLAVRDDFWRDDAAAGAAGVAATCAALEAKASEAAALEQEVAALRTSGDESGAQLSELEASRAEATAAAETLRTELEAARAEIEAEAGP